MPPSSSFDFSRRDERLELIDTVAYPEAVVRETLDFLRLTNRYFGGEGVVLSKLERWTRGRPPGEPLRILDVGTGGADIPVAMVRWARKRGRTIRVTGLDLTPEIAALARERTREYPEIEIRCGDLFELAGGGERFDVVTASLLLHHMPPDKTVATLRAFDRLALRGVIVSDLLRSRRGYGAVALLSWLAGNFVVRHDGPLSVRRAFRPEELAELAREAGLGYLNARHEPWFRVSLSGEKPDGPAG